MKEPSTPGYEQANCSGGGSFIAGLLAKVKKIANSNS
jgi:hypothetical protein